MNAVTGAFSYTGSHIARRLLDDGKRVRTLSRTPDLSHPLADKVEYAQLQFDNPRELLESLRGIDTLYNTYWIRFPRGEATWERTLDRTRTLVRAAGAAGVSRIVHVSVTNPSPDDTLDYYRYKALAEDVIREAPLSYAIVRPTLVFARDDILLNNIAWVLRRFPLFVIARDGSYRVQPVAARDVASICVTAGRRSDDIELDAAGTETVTYGGMVAAIRSAVGGRARVIHAPPGVTVALGRIAGVVKRDTLLARQELDGLMSEKLVSHEPAQGTTSFSGWLAAYGAELGRTYASEWARNWRGQPI